MNNFPTWNDSLILERTKSFNNLFIDFFASLVLILSYFLCLFVSCFEVLFSAVKSEIV